MQSNFCRHWPVKRLRSTSSLLIRLTASRSELKRKKAFLLSSSDLFSPENKCKLTMTYFFCCWRDFAHSDLFSFFRNDDKTAQDYKVQGGSVLHLVLALRGGFWIIDFARIWVISYCLLSTIIYTFIWLSIKTNKHAKYSWKISVCLQVLQFSDSIRSQFQHKISSTVENISTLDLFCFQTNLKKQL